MAESYESGNQHRIIHLVMKIRMKKTMFFVFRDDYECRQPLFHIHMSFNNEDKGFM